MGKDYKVPAARLYQDSLLIGEKLTKELSYGKDDPQPVKVMDVAGQEYLGELRKKYKVLSGVGEIFRSSGASPTSTILLTVQKARGRAPAVLMRVDSTGATAPSAMLLGLHHKASGALRRSEGTPFYLDPARLKTHAFVCGMTGSGKTVLTKAITEEALLENIPVVVIDLKGDLASLGIIPLALSPDELAVFCKEEGDATGMEYARALGEREKTKSGLSDYDISDDRCKSFAKAIDVKVFTPGANYGIPLSLANQLTPPGNVEDLRTTDSDLYREMCSAVTDAFLDRMYPTSRPQAYERERAFMHTLIRWCWDNNENLVGEEGLKRLQDLIIDPPFIEVGGVPITEFIDKGARRVRLRDKLATQLAEPENRWYIGDPLTADMLVHRRNGKTPLSIISVTHLNTFEERAFVIAQVSYALTSWMRTLGETDLPRVLLVVDEIGAQGGPTSLFPSYPKDPPSKRFLNQIIRQGRSFGVCALLATQNPSDIDYKALSNCGLWMVGSLNTNRDRSNVMQGMGLDDMRKSIVQGWIAGAGQGEFVVRDVQASAPIMIRVRWLMTQHRGLDRQKLRSVCELWNN